MKNQHGEYKKNGSVSFVPQILAVDDEPGVLQSLQLIFAEEYNFFTAQNAAEATEVLNKRNIQIVILDLCLPDMPGMELLKKIKERNNHIECVVLTADTALASGIEAMKLGAYDYLVKPFDADRLALIVQNSLERAKLRKEVQYYRSREKEESDLKILIGKSPPMEQCYELIRQTAAVDATVLLTGESGTGKELVARAIHRQSSRKNNPFVTINCGSIPKELVESELFGHQKGSFTGAFYSRAGKFEFAHQGTLFLDEIGLLSLSSQTKLLRVLQEKTIERIGTNQQVMVDARIIAATNLNLQQEMENNRFRKDLYYRINILPITLPPLRERKSDIPLLTEYFLNVYNQKYNKRVNKLSDELMDYFCSYDWPGNVRELENMVQRLLAIATGNEISVQHLPLEMITRCQVNESEKKVCRLKEAVDRFEREYIQRILTNTKSYGEAAELLGIHRNTLLLKMKELKLGDYLPKPIPAIVSPKETAS